jgi:hypothetical protein
MAKATTHQHLQIFTHLYAYMSRVISYNPRNYNKIIGGQGKSSYVKVKITHGLHKHLILTDPFIVDYSREISTKCSFVIEFIIPKFIEGSTCFERHTANHQEL